MNHSYRQDPDPFTIATLVLAGAGLLLNLEQKIESRKGAKALESNERARTDLRVRLGRIRRSLSLIQEFWLFFENNGQYEVVEGDALSVAYGSSRKYFNEAEYKEFNIRLDETLKNIGIINKELYAIKLDDIIISDDLRKNFKLSVDKLREELTDIVTPMGSITKRLLRVKEVLRKSGVLIDELRYATGTAVGDGGDGGLYNS